jgi:hypothetical protein
VAFSFGSHDEWNIVRAINAKRTAKKDGEDAFGVAKQIAVMFNGVSVAPGLFDAPTATGNEGQCPLPKVTCPRYDDLQRSLSAPGGHDLHHRDPRIVICL